MSNETKQKKDSWKDYEVGGMWENKGGSFFIQVDLKDGKGKMILKAFPNKFKNESKHPDFKVYKDLPDRKKVSMNRKPNRATEEEEDLI